MEKQQDIIGYIGLGISSVGAIASVITNNVAFASLPLTVGVACNLFSRKQYNDALVEAHNTQQQSINDLIQKVDANQTQLNEQLAENRQDLENLVEELKKSISNSLDEQNQGLSQEINKLDLQHQELHKLVSTLEQVEHLSQSIRNKENSAKSYYERGLGYEQLGNKEGALKDYSEAIKHDSSLAKAYHKRGVIYLEKGEQQKAVDDLRKAALLYFEQGDIDSYHQAREMSRNIHDLRVANKSEIETEMVVGSDLFS